MNPLLAAILADPGDDDARRVYADSLIANGDPRGDFIALQCELAKCDPEIQDIYTKPLWDRERELREQYAMTWERPLRALGEPTRWWWHRGFIRAVATRSSHDNTQALASLLATEPVVELGIGGGIGGDDNIVAEHLALPGIERIRRLAVLVDDITVVAGAKQLKSVRELRIGGGSMALQDLEPLFKPKALSRVTHLALGFRCRATDLAKLAKTTLGKQLETFEYVHPETTVEIAEVVLAMPKLRVFGYTWANAEARALIARFRGQTVCEPRGGYFANGLPGISYRPLPSPSPNALT